MAKGSIQYLELEHPEKGILAVPYRQYQLNEDQQFAVIAIDFLEGIELGNHDGIKYDQLGKLLQQNFIFQQQIINSLMIDQWDFNEYRNPEIVLITKL